MYNFQIHESYIHQFDAKITIKQIENHLDALLPPFHMMKACSSQRIIKWSKASL